MEKDESSEIKRTQIHEAVKLRLWGMSAGRCEICNKLLYLDSRYGDDANFAENAHIHAVGKTGPRHVKYLEDAMLEPDHHKWTEYVGDRVRKSKDVVWGILVEEWCKQCLGQDASNYFIEMVRNALI